MENGNTINFIIIWCLTVININNKLTYLLKFSLKIYKITAAKLINSSLQKCHESKKKKTIVTNKKNIGLLNSTQNMCFTVSEA